MRNKLLNECIYTFKLSNDVTRCLVFFHKNKLIKISSNDILYKRIAFKKILIYLYWFGLNLKPNTLVFFFEISNEFYIQHESSFKGIKPWSQWSTFEQGFELKGKSLTYLYDLSREHSTSCYLPLELIFC